MAPTRTSRTNQADETKTEPTTRPPNSTSSVNKSRRLGNSSNAATSSSKQGASNASSNAQNAQADAMTGLDWISEEQSVLQRYRTAHRLDTPSAFRSPLNSLVLSANGIGNNSPTMARRKDKQKAPKEQLALAVRKHFNSLAVNDTDVMGQFLYKAKSQNRSYRMHFTPH